MGLGMLSQACSNISEILRNVCRLPDVFSNVKNNVFWCVVKIPKGAPRHSNSFICFKNDLKGKN